MNVIHDGVGGINESDVMLASASDAVIIGFNVRPVGDARQVAEREGVEIRTYSVIYKVVEELRAAMEGLLEPEEVESTSAPPRCARPSRHRASARSPAATSPRARSAAARGAARPRRHDHLRRPDRLAAPLQGRRARGGDRGMRVRHRRSRTTPT